MGWEGSSACVAGRTRKYSACLRRVCGKLANSYHVYRITRRGYGASSRPSSGYTEERLAADDLCVFESLGLVKPIVAGHSIAGNELSQLRLHYYDRIGGLIFLDALNDGSDDYTDYDVVTAKLPDAMKKLPSPSPSDLKSFPAYQEWRERTDGVAYPEAELRAEFAENPDESIGGRITPSYVPAAIMEGNHKHDYSQIRVPVLAFIGYPKPPQDHTGKPHIRPCRTHHR